MTCENCQEQNKPASKFCEACGARLVATPPNRPHNPQTMLVDPPAPPAVEPAAALTVQLSLLDGKQFTLAGAGQYGIGRADPASHWQPAVDLAPHGGELGGVSRRHAAITISASDGKAYVSDSGSSNGTTLNSSKIEPHSRQPLQSGDQLLFGRILARVRIVQAASR